MQPRNHLEFEGGPVKLDTSAASVRPARAVEAHSRETQAPGGKTPWRCPPERQESSMKFVLFTDNLADLSIPQACTAAKEAGFDGLDLTLRPGGHVLPDAAEVGLAEARRVADRAGISIPMVST